MNMNYLRFDYIVSALFVLAVLALASMLTGCATGEREGWRASARASGSETHSFNMARLEAEIAHSQQPLVEFRASPEALKVLAASGQPLELIVNNPYLSISRPESPWWHRLVPEFRDLAWVGTTIWQVERNYSTSKRQISASDRRHERDVESRARLEDAIIANQAETENGGM